MWGSPGYFYCWLTVPACGGGALGHLARVVVNRQISVVGMRVPFRRGRGNSCSTEKRHDAQANRLEPGLGRSVTGNRKWPHWIGICDFGCCFDDGLELRRFSGGFRVPGRLAKLSLRQKNLGPFGGSAPRFEGSFRDLLSRFGECPKF